MVSGSASPRRSETTDIEVEYGFPALPSRGVDWSTRLSKQSQPPMGDATPDPDLAAQLCSYAYAHLAGVDPAFVWDNDIGSLPTSFAAGPNDNMLKCAHPACRMLYFKDRQLLAMHWNRYHVASVPCFTCTLPDCTFPPTTYCDVFNQHWETTHSETILTTALASAAVSLAVNPLYFHDPRRDVVTA